jgi:hypothetical protein
MHQEFLNPLPNLTDNSGFRFVAQAAMLYGLKRGGGDYHLKIRKSKWQK